MRQSVYERLAFEIKLPFPLLEINNCFRKEETVTTRERGGTGNSKALAEFRVRLVYRIEFWTTSGLLLHGD